MSGKTLAVVSTMTSEKIDELVKEYLAYLRWERFPEVIPTNKAEAKLLIEALDTRSRENPHTRAIYPLFGLIHDDPRLAWQICRRIINEADEPDLGLFGAGDLETFVTCHAINFADQIESEIRSSGRFREAFKSVHLGSDMPREIGMRFNTALVECGVSEEWIIDWWSDEQAQSTGDDG